MGFYGQLEVLQVVSRWLYHPCVNMSVICNDFVDGWSYCLKPDFWEPLLVFDDIWSLCWSFSFQDSLLGVALSEVLNTSMQAFGAFSWMDTWDFECFHAFS